MKHYLIPFKGFDFKKAIKEASEEDKEFLIELEKRINEIADTYDRVHKRLSDFLKTKLDKPVLYIVNYLKRFFKIKGKATYYQKKGKKIIQLKFDGKKDFEEQMRINHLILVHELCHMYTKAELITKKALKRIGLSGSIVFLIMQLFPPAALIGGSVIALYAKKKKVLIEGIAEFLTKLYNEKEKIIDPEDFDKKISGLQKNYHKWSNKYAKKFSKFKGTLKEFLIKETKVKIE